MDVDVAERIDGVHCSNGHSTQEQRSEDGTRVVGRQAGEEAGRGRCGWATEAELGRASRATRGQTPKHRRDLQVTLAQQHGHDAVFASLR